MIELPDYDVTQDYKHLLDKISEKFNIPKHKLVIEEHPCEEDCIFSSDGKWLGYISDFEE